MRALPDQIDAQSEDQITGVACPSCPGMLVVRSVGDQDFLQFECRIGHVFSLQELLQGKEDKAEDYLWSAVLAFQELAALLEDLEARGSSGDAESAQRYRQRSRDASRLAAALRDLIGQDRPLRLEAPSRVRATDKPEPPASTR